MAKLHTVEIKDIKSKSPKKNAIRWGLVVNFIQLVLQGIIIYMLLK